ncbi:MAG: hypothetical protein HOQ05_09530, partial [Corynebacteriales bacterium]|nr:hypothetical protein [Mycobacteriales bacterium]
MKTGWAEPAEQHLTQQENAPYHAARRTALAKNFPGETLIIPTGVL